MIERFVDCITIHNTLIDNFAVQLDRRRLAAGMTTREIADQLTEMGLPITRSMLTKIVYGTLNTVDLLVVEGCAKIFDVPVMEMLVPFVPSSAHALTVGPNFYGCHDPRCLDSTWDHECPVTPEPAIESANEGQPR